MPLKIVCAVELPRIQFLIKVAQGLAVTHLAEFTHHLLEHRTLLLAFLALKYCAFPLIVPVGHPEFHIAVERIHSIGWIAQPLHCGW
jgi:hypothetical protein